MAELIVHNPPRAALKASGYIGSPEGDIELTENDTTYNVASFASATVKIPEEEKTVTPSTTRQEVTPDIGLLSKVTVLPASLEERTVTPAIVQQEITPEAPAIGLSKVTVGAAPPLPTLITKQITENGTYSAEDETPPADGYSEVEVNVSDPIVNQLLDGTCTELINHSVTSLKQYCYYQNDALQKIYCKEVTTLGFACFQGVHYLMVAFFPKITMIGYNIFYSSGSSRPEGMQALILKKQVTLRDRGSFTQNTTNFYVPSALLSWYSSATNWSAYYGGGRILAIEDNLEFLESFGFTEEELLSAEE
ncbi:hypothetical protein [Ruminococcus sp.]|uniref:hypothetical protein n=1 Tax=Ruminococcus sp. TaxID=41978 RepID=UPI0038680F28